MIYELLAIWYVEGIRLHVLRTIRLKRLRPEAKFRRQPEASEPNTSRRAGQSPPPTPQKKTLFKKISKDDDECLLYNTYMIVCCVDVALPGLGAIFATAPRNTHCAYSPAAILAGYVVKCVIESSQRAPREL